MENMQLSPVKLPPFDLINVLTGEGMKEETGREYYSPNAIDTYTATMCRSHFLNQPKKP